MSGLVRNSAMQTNAIVGKPVISTVAQVDSHKLETPKFDKGKIEMICLDKYLIYC